MFCHALYLMLRMIRLRSFLFHTYKMEGGREGVMEEECSGGKGRGQHWKGRRERRKRRRRVNSTFKILVSGVRIRTIKLSDTL